MTEQLSKFDPKAEVEKEMFVDDVLARLSAVTTPEACQNLLEYVFAFTKDNDPRVFLLYLACNVKAKHVACGAFSGSDNDRVIHAAEHFKGELNRINREDTLVKKIIEYYNTQICKLVIKNVWMPSNYRQLSAWVVS